MTQKDQDIQKITESLSPIERKIMPHLDKKIKHLSQETKLDNTSILRALQFLSNKGIIILEKSAQEIVDLDTNGIYYKKTSLPERKLILLLEKNNHLSIPEAKKLSKLSDNEFKVSLGVLKSKAILNVTNGKLSLTASATELTKKSPEELLLENLPKPLNQLTDVEKFALSKLQKRKNIIEIKTKTAINYSLTEIGKEIQKQNLNIDLIEEVTPELIKNWQKQKNKKFRNYDIRAKPPRIYPAKKHFVNQAVEYGKQIWLDLGFEEMTSTIAQTSFWNFDALFTAQDHPVREMHDTFFIKDVAGNLPNDKKLIESVKKSHESGISRSKGWQYSWNEEEAKTPVLRTHTTCLSAHTLHKIKPKDIPAKFFSVGRCFRNETVDWSHGFEFNQTEGIVIDENANFLNLLGYLKEFFKKMGFEKIRFTPAYFPYTEPSVEINWYHPEKKQWLELGGAGIFRPELTTPLLGKHIPVLAWGPGFDRIIMDYYKISDLRTMYQNNLSDLRTKPVWIK